MEGGFIKRTFTNNCNKPTIFFHYKNDHSLFLRWAMPGTSKCWKIVKGGGFTILFSRKKKLMVSTVDLAILQS